MKEITIKVPDNCELKQDGNTYTIVEKEKKVTYESIRDKELPKHFYVRNDIQCTSYRQYQKLLAINKLINLAKWLNGDWQPDWTCLHERRWYVFIGEGDKIEVSYSNYHCGDIYFKSRELAKQAIEILGEETIKLALCTDY